MDVILLAAGLGTRMNLNCPKQFMKLRGKPIFVYSLELFSSLSEIGQIILTCNHDCMDEYKKYVEQYHIPNVVYVVGGDTRQESVYRAIPYVKTEQVLIHEAARPLISKDLVLSILHTREGDAVVPTVPVKFTVIEGTDYMTGELVRSSLHNVQLPQMFKTSVLKDVHEKAKVEGYQATEDGMMAFHYGYVVKLIAGRESNIKITTQLDLELVNNLLNM